MLGLDDQVILNGLMNLDSVDSIAKVLLASEEHLLLHAASLVVAKSGRERLALIAGTVAA